MTGCFCLFGFFWFLVFGFCFPDLCTEMGNARVGEKKATKLEIVVGFEF